MTHSVEQRSHTATPTAPSRELMQRWALMDQA